MNFSQQQTATRPSSESVKPSLTLGYALNRIRFQLIGGALFAVIIPHLIRTRFDLFSDPIIRYDTTLVGTFCSLIFGYMIFRKMTALPGAKSIVNVMPSFMISYGAVAALFFGLRLDFSRYEFVMSFALTVIFFLFVLVIVNRAQKPSFAILPFGRAKVLTHLNAIQWTVVEDIQDAQRYPHTALVADLTSPDITEDWQRYLADEAIRGRSVFNAKQLLESMDGKVQIEHLSENTFGHLAPDSLYAPAKRYIDFTVALLALALLSPILILIALMIRMTSAGPAIFKQTRMGYQGREFTVLKFRSMREQDPALISAETDMTAADDSRITKVGRFIRKTRLDELPQLINIIKGEMSLIGPRPETLRLSKWYETEIPFYRYRHIVRPGITGWAQIKQGHVTSLKDVREKLGYDFYYVKNFSVWLDILIVFQTVKIILTGHGAK